MSKFRDSFRLESIDEYAPHNAYTLLFGDKEIGKIIRDINGFFYYWPLREGGCFGAHELLVISEILTDLNEEWEEQVTIALNGECEERASEDSNSRQSNPPFDDASDDEIP